jgi:ubiquinone biosynthesis protein UbiJ
VVTSVADSDLETTYDTLASGILRKVIDSNDASEILSALQGLYACDDRQDNIVALLASLCSHLRKAMTPSTVANQGKRKRKGDQSTSSQMSLMVELAKWTIGALLPLVGANIIVEDEILDQRSRVYYSGGNSETKSANPQSGARQVHLVRSFVHLVILIFQI